MSDEVATQSTDSESAAAAPYRMALVVDVQNVGPCRKHVRVKVPRSDIEHFSERALEEVSETAAVPGFRAGRVPSALIRRRYKKELSDQVRQQILLQSLEQLAEENKLDPINEPDFDVETLEIPDEGDFEYEFDIEVRPEFDLPDYNGLKIERPVKQIAAEDVDAFLQRVLRQFSSNEATEEPAQAGDFVNVTLEFRQGETLLRRVENTPIEIVPVVRFEDAELAGFETLMVGTKAGDTRKATVTIASEAEQVEMRGETVDVEITVNSVSKLIKPELDSAFAERLGYESLEEFRNSMERRLEQQSKFDERQATRRQVLDKITESATWDLPEQLVVKQVENALRREMLEMEQAGFTWAQIRARENEIRQKSVTTTRQALKEHFVLDRIATDAKIEVEPYEIDSEIHMMALQQGENPRRVRARLIKSGVIENLEAQIRERKAVDHILKSATIVDVPAPKKDDAGVTAVPVAICTSGPRTTDVHEHDHDGDDHDHDHDHA